MVSNTPRTLVEIMNELVSQLIYKLAAESTDLRMVAGRALGEVVRKLGDRVLPAVVPHLRAGLEGGDLGMREGVCLGLAEILQASTRRQIEDYIGVLVPALQQGLCDPSEVVRSQAARAFVTLTKALGPRAIEDVLPTLVEQVGAAREEGQVRGRFLSLFLPFFFSLSLFRIPFFFPFFDFFPPGLVIFFLVSFSFHFSFFSPSSFSLFIFFSPHFPLPLRVQTPNMPMLGLREIVQAKSRYFPLASPPFSTFYPSPFTHQKNYPPKFKSPKFNSHPANFYSR